MMNRVATGLFVLLLAVMPTGLAGSAPLGAQEDDPEAVRARLDALEAELKNRAQHQKALAEEASALGREAEALARRAVALAAEMQATEERLAATLEKIASLEAMLAAQRAELARRRGQSAETLSALMRLARRPEGLALLGPSEAEDSMRTALLLRETIPALEAAARDIGERVQRILRLADELAAEKSARERESATLAARRAEAEALREVREHEREQRLAEAEDESRAIARIASEARSLEELIAALDAERTRRRAAAEAAAAAIGRLPPPVSAPIASARGTLPLPARGRLVRHFGDHDGPVTDKGITIATLPGAQVVAPYDGRVLFSGPFRGYRQLLIIDHGDGYHSLLAGMDRVDAAVGQWVLAGEPVGMMAGNPPGGRIEVSSPEGEPKLYVELRERGQPVDPLPWLASGAGKVS